MKNLISLILLNLLAFCTSAQVLRPFAPRYYNTSVRGNIVYVSNSIISTNGISASGTAEMPPGGSSRNNSGTGLYLDVVTDPTPTTLFGFGSQWKYFANGTRPANWETVGFNDASWSTGLGDFGYGDGPIYPEVTCVPSGYTPICAPVGNNKYWSYYFRKTIDLGSIKDNGDFVFNYKRDDGIVVYVNGTEVFRNNMPTGTVAYNTAASADITGAAEYAINTFTLKGSSPFVPGANVIAVEIHQRAVGISDADISFDMELRSIETYNSTTSDLAIPTTCNQVLFAGLYWGADLGSSGTNTSWIMPGFDSVLFKIPGASTYNVVRSQQTDQHSNTNSPGLGHTGYLCFADVTSLINTTNANGTYTVANVMGPLNLTNGCGGWTLVIAYSNPSLLPRNLTVFDGSVIINSGDPAVDLNFTGFLTPPAGPVSCEIGTVVYDGDRGSVDAFQFRQTGAPLFYNLANTTVPLNGLNDAWNSKISYKGSMVTTRNPAFNNTLGYDASIFELPNTGNVQLSNGQTGATVRLSSSGENYFTHVITTSISQYNPAFALSKSSVDVNGGSIIAGDSLEYIVNYRNVGNDASVQTTILDNIPLGTTYLPGSLRINGVSRTDAASDDEAEFDFTNNRVVLRVGTGATSSAGGNIPVNTSGEIRFRVLLPTSCSILACLGSTIRNTARMNYVGLTSSNTLYDSSGVDVAGCITLNSVNNFVLGPCSTFGDTILTNRCPSNAVTLSLRRYAGFRFYNAQPFNSASLFNPATAITSSGVYWAFFDNGVGCSDTVRIRVIINPCPDIDDDNDGIPDYVELNDPLALQNHDGDAFPNWNDATYPGYVDNNSDGFNDRFDPSADMDNDGILNFYDADFPGFVDSNADGVNDNMDKDRDGVPNHIDLDSDNDGIPDVVESYGVDANGDGIIDNYSTTDNDGFSQNVDASNSGVTGSGNGLGAPDLDGDGIPNYLDSDSDNDGIPDLVEALGADANHDALVDVFTDIDADGLTDPLDSDIGNDLVAENTALSLLRTGADGNGDGRADSYPFKNFDNDGRANPYDIDADGDGIIDLQEAGFADANYNGIIDGSFDSFGWSNTVKALPALVLPNTDGIGNPNWLDIDSDGDGIPDNIEGQSTYTYKLPAAADADGDGLDNAYDLAPFAASFGGPGILIHDLDVDAIPDYMDLDTDSDGMLDIIEGNDFNLNGLMDDNVTPTGVDADADGLDDHFDLIISTTNRKGTSALMGTNGALTGDATPGGRTTVQRTIAVVGGCPFERDWRCVSLVLPVRYLSLASTDDGHTVSLKWDIICDQPIDIFEIERSTDNIHFSKIAEQDADPIRINQLEHAAANDKFDMLDAAVIFYRIKVIAKDGQVAYSNIILVRKQTKGGEFNIFPNPANELVNIKYVAEKETEAVVTIFDALGKLVKSQKIRLYKGNNTVPVTGLGSCSNGVYQLRLNIDSEIHSSKLIIQR
jgi:uncharacterized repeat protein (TIGR01451 family)